MYLLPRPPKDRNLGLNVPLRQIKKSLLKGGSYAKFYLMDASIAPNGAILLGDKVTCDAHWDRSLRIVTHAHADHLWGLEESLKYCQQVISSPATKDLVEILRGIPGLTPLPFGELREFEGERLTLFNAGHILGSAQVLVEKPDGRRILYSGDFCLSRAEVIPADTLVMEATYGHPGQVRRFKHKLERMMGELLEKLLRSGPVYIFGYHGKLLEVLAILKRLEVGVPIILPQRTCLLAQLGQRYGMEFPSYLSSTSEEGRRATSDTHIVLYHTGAKRYIGGGASRITLSGWEFDYPWRQISERDYILALSDHSDFEELLEYVKRCSPQLVITDNYRVGDAQTLACQIRENLNIEAVSMP